MKTSKVTVGAVQSEGMRLAGGIAGASAQGAVSALAKKYAPDSVKPFIDPATIVAGVLLSTVGRKSEFLQNAGLGMALVPGWGVVKDQLQKVVPQFDNDNAFTTMTRGATGMARPLNGPNRVPMRALRSGMKRNDTIRNGGATRVAQYDFGSA